MDGHISKSYLVINSVSIKIDRLIDVARSLEENQREALKLCAYELQKMGEVLHYWIIKTTNCFFFIFIVQLCSRCI